MSNPIIVDALVIGAGPSGTVAASMLNQAGHSVRIVEREKFPRFVIGESLLPRCMEALEAAGFLPALEAQGFQKKNGAKFLRGNRVCDFNFSDGYTPGWDWTWQVKRADFDATLATAVQKQGVPIDFETEVVAIEMDAERDARGDHCSTTTLRAKDGSTQTVRARFLVDASGYGRVMPRMFGLDKVSGQLTRRARFAHLTDPRRSEDDEPNRIQIISHHVPGVWAWVIPFSDGVTSVGFVGNPDFFDGHAGSTLEDQYRDMLATEVNTARRFHGAEFVLAPRELKGWSVTTENFFGDGFVLAGNATEFLDPIFSSGVTLATTSGHRAGVLAARQLSGQAVDWQREYVEPTMIGVNTFRAYVDAWYDGRLERIFYAKDPDPSVKRYICSVLAGYVWDQTNPYVKRGARALDALDARVRAEVSYASAATSAT